MTLKISEEQAKELYLTASKEIKIILEETFTKEFFSTKITDRVQTLDDIYKILGKKREDLIPHKNPKTKQQKSQNALVDIQSITEVYNEGKELDWNNSNQYKYIPYFHKNSGGWVFSSCDSFSSSCSASFGLYFFSSKLAIDAGKKFIKVYNEYLS